MKFASVHVDKPNAFQRTFLWSDKTEIELFGLNNKWCVWSKGETLKPKNTKPSTMIVVAKYSGAVMLPVVLVDNTNGRNIQTEDHLQII